jgi:hypothetical protein
MSTASLVDIRQSLFKSSHHELPATF